MSEQELKPKIGITLGDFNGIGPEIIIKTLADELLCNHLTPIVYASVKVMTYYRKMFGYNDFQFHVIKSINEIQTGRPNLINCWEEELDIKIGTAQGVAGSYAIRSLDLALTDAMQGKLDGIVTAPLNKSTVKIPNNTFTGHTGYIGDKLQAKPLMMLISDELKITPATEHIPLREVSSALNTSMLVEKITELHNAMVKDFAINKPKIAVLGLNPHAGESGLLGKEEQEIILPAINQCKEKGIIVYGCYPADGFFGSGQFKQFDAVLSMYHDQGLIPFKLLSFDDGVNYTAGLPIVRTSPDHGTAYNIAGKGEASITSFLNAIFMAAHTFSNRQMNEGLRKSPLKFSQIKRERFRLDI